jgi:hypothetical protein
MILLAHGIGSRGDLPIPFAFAVAGAAVALVISFVVLTVAWRRSRFRGDDSGRALPAWLTAAVDAAATRWVIRLSGLAAFGFTVMTAYVAPDGFSNPTAGLVFVVFWLGLVPASLVLGPVWRVANPIRTLHLVVSRAARRSPDRGLVALPAGLGYWPGAAGLLGFGWLELVAPDRATTSVIGTFLAAYVAVHLVGAVTFGSRWLDKGDAFEVLSALIGRLSPFGRRSDGRIVVRSPLANLDGLPAGPGLAAVVCVLLGTTAYDSVTGWAGWVRWTQSSPLGDVLAGTLGLVGCVVIVLAAYLLSMVLSARLVGGAVDLPGRFAHSLVPIVLGYFVAHYVTLFVIEGQRTLIKASDPFSRGDNWFGTADWVVDQSIALHPTLIASLQVGAIVVGHVLGAVAAHDRSVRIFPTRRATIGQLPLLTLMVGYTAAGLLLLFAG